MKQRQPQKKSGTPKPQPATEPYQGNQIEADFVADHLKRKRERVAAPKLKVIDKSNEAIRFELDHTDDTLWTALVHAGTGSLDWPFSAQLLHQLLNAATGSSDTGPLDTNETNGVLAAMHGIAPKDELEAMLAAQMVATHYAAMTVLRRLKGCKTIMQQDSAGNLANKLLRTYAAQLEALARYRGKGQQTVRVEHVTVQAGGQAIVGAVNAGTTPGRGGSNENQRQPHAIAHAPAETLPREIEAGREAVAVASG
jgi:hypothetical protein